MIILKNISNNDVFNYPLIQIRGKIDQNCYCTKICVLNVTSDKKCLWPITCFGYFKVFCDLLHGINVIKLFCSHDNIEIRVTLKIINFKMINSFEIMLIICKNDKNEVKLNKNDKIIDNKIILAVKLVQCFIAESFSDNGYQKRSFNLKPNVRYHYTKLTLKECLNKNERELWSIFSREILEKYKNEINNTKWIGFLTATQYCPLFEPRSHEDIIKFTKAHCALGANGLALLGTGTLYCFPEKLEYLSDILVNFNNVDRTILMDDSAFRGSYYANYSTALGTILHEMAHCMGLGHSSSGIMFRGGDDINIVLFFPPIHSDNNEFCEFCCLEKMSSSQRRQIEKVSKEKSFVLSRCKSLNHRGQCFWSVNNLIMLNFHKWFSSRIRNTSSSETQFTLTKNLIKAVNPLILLEIRTLHPQNLCVGFTDFRNKVIYEQTLSAKRMSLLIKMKSALRSNDCFILVIMDIVGNIISVEFKLKMEVLYMEILKSTIKVID